LRYRLNYSVYFEKRVRHVADTLSLPHYRKRAESCTLAITRVACAQGKEKNLRRFYRRTASLSLSLATKLGQVRARAAQKRAVYGLISA